MNSENPASRLKMLLCAFLIGFIVVSLNNLLLVYTIGSEFLIGGSVGFGVNVLFVAVPFIVLAFRGSARAAPWLLGILSTLALWGYALLKSIEFHRASSGGSLDKGLLLIMALSPILITIICLGNDQVKRSQERETKEPLKD